MTLPPYNSTREDVARHLVRGPKPCLVGLIISHRLPLSQAPAAFQKFDQRIDGYIKVILDPQR